MESTDVRYIVVKLCRGNNNNLYFISLFQSFITSVFLLLVGIHEPVEAFKKHLAPKVHDLFKNSLTPNAPIWRANWAVFNDLEGPLDLFTPDGHDKRNEANKTNDYQGIIV